MEEKTVFSGVLKREGFTMLHNFTVGAFKDKDGVEKLILHAQEIEEETNELWRKGKVRLWMKESTYIGAEILEYFEKRVKRDKLRFHGQLASS